MYDEHMDDYRYLYIYIYRKIIYTKSYTFSFPPNSFTVGVLNAVLSVSALAGMLCPPPWSCVSLVSGLVSHLVFQLVWAAVSVVWACLKNFMCDFCNCLGSTVV